MIELSNERLAELLKVAESAIPPFWNEQSERFHLKRFSDHAGPHTIAALVREVIELRGECGRITKDHNELSEEVETCHSLLDQYYAQDTAMTSADTLERRLKLHLDELCPIITDADVNGED